MQTEDKIKGFVDEDVLSDNFLVGKGNKVHIDHNSFSKYIIKKYNIEGVEGALFQYQGEIWKAVHRNMVDKIILSEMENILLEHIGPIRNGDRENIYKFILTHAENTKLKDKLNEKDSSEINLADGILNTKTRTIRPYSKEDYKLHKLNYTSAQLKDTTKPEKWLNFLEDILEGWNNKEEIISFLQEFIGYLFIPSTKFERALLLYGSGANGKGVLLDVIRNLIGNDACVSIGLHEINKDQNLFLLLGNLVTIDSDMQQGVQLDSGIIKKIISGEPIVGKVVYQRPISFVPYIKLLIACNELPYLRSADHSIKRRFTFFHLKKSFVGKEDPSLKEKLKEELNQIFVRSLEGLKRLLERGEFLIPAELKADVENFIKENDSVIQWLEDDNLYIEDDLFISNKDLYESYRIFCTNNGFKPLGMMKLTKRLVEKGYERHNNGFSRGIKGIGAKPR